MEWRQDVPLGASIARAFAALQSDLRAAELMQCPSREGRRVGKPRAACLAYAARCSSLAVASLVLVLELIGEADAAPRIIVRRRAGHGPAAAACEGGLQLQILGQIDLHLALRAARDALLGADIDAARDVFAGLDGRTGGIAGGAAHRE